MANDDPGRGVAIPDSPVHEDEYDRVNTRIVPVVLSGGLGTRLWPLSRANMPKQALRLWGTEPMIAATARRLTGLTDEPPVVVCNADQRFVVADALGRQGLPLGTLILEPIARSTAPAIAV